MSSSPTRNMKKMRPISLTKPSVVSELGKHRGRHVGREPTSTDGREDPAVISAITAGWPTRFARRASARATASTSASCKSNWVAEPDTTGQGSHVRPPATDLK